ncbi:MAG TPA: hypothetical protein VFP15_03960, partial [Gemmatimonadaceae bacterium]|nr:hypothetical protein [Gemmatimonadaceae bacterium]
MMVRFRTQWPRGPFVTGSLAVAFLLTACTRERAPEQAVQQPPAQLPASGSPRATAPLTADDGQWTMPAKDYAGLRYSQLAEITTANVKNLVPKWTFSTSVLRGHEEGPLVVNNTMYIVTPFPNLLYALDLTKPGAPVKWSYDPKPRSEAQGVACCDVV